MGQWTYLVAIDPVLAGPYVGEGDDMEVPNPIGNRSSDWKSQVVIPMCILQEVLRRLPHEELPFLRRQSKGLALAEMVGGFAVKRTPAAGIVVVGLEQMTRFCEGAGEESREQRMVDGLQGDHSGFVSHGSGRVVLTVEVAQVLEVEPGGYRDRGEELVEGLCGVMTIEMIEIPWETVWIDAPDGVVVEEANGFGVKLTARQETALMTRDLKVCRGSPDDIRTFVVTTDELDSRTEEAVLVDLGSNLCRKCGEKGRRQSLGTGSHQGQHW